jgi:starch phosphorylase
MAFLAARLSSCTNAVSRLHGEVTRKMAQPMWAGYPLSEVPIGYVTNGIHARTWTSMEMSRLLDRYLGPRWADEPSNHALWERIGRIPDQELWRVHQIRRERLIGYARARLATQIRQRGGSGSDVSIADDVLASETLTIGFARRFATYKRATLLLRDPARFKRILTNPQRPVQMLFAGKAHPHDNAGKDLIQQVVHFARDPEIRDHIVFLENYDISVARYLVQGCDVWLNTPRRPNEASGTSGMKLLPNGGLNLSILDGWWDEAYTPEVGWAIGSGEEYADENYQDDVESRALYHLLEHEVVPLFYDRDAQGIPRGWIAKMKASMGKLTPIFNTSRMVAEYAEKFYIPAHERHLRLAAEHGKRVYQLVEWRKRLRAHGSEVKITDISSEHPADVVVGSKFKVTARIVLGGVVPGDVQVQLYYGNVDSEGRIVAGKTAGMSLAQSTGPDYTYQGEVECQDSGSCGFTVRVIPLNADAILPYELPWIVWAE